VDEPRKAWQAAVDLVKRQLPGVNAYVAALTDEAPPDEAVAAAGDEAGDGDGGEADEAGGVPADVLAALALAAPADGGGDAGAGDEGGGGEEGAEAAAPPRPDYSGAHLAYVAASTGQEFLTRLELRRAPLAGAAAGGDGGASGAAPAAAVTFRLLDERLPLLEVGEGE
jgi:hypothetical protein